MFAAFRKVLIAPLIVLVLAAVACDDDLPSANPAPPVASVRVTPGEPTLTVGESVLLRATAHDPEGEPLPERPIAWTSETPAVATVSTDGTVIALAAGTAVVTATSGGRAGRAAVTVRPRAPEPVARVELDATAATLSAGATRQLAAVARDAAGNPLDGRPLAWSTSDAAVAAVSPTGLLTAVAPGTATIAVGVEGKQATAAITVTPRPGTVVRVSLDPVAATISEGQTLAMVATPRDADDRPIGGLPVAWTSADPSIATVSANGRVEGLRVGTTQITASVSGRTATAAVTVQTIPAFAYDLAYDLTRGIGGVGPELFLLDIRFAGTVARRAFAQSGTWDVTASPDGTKLAFVQAGLLGTEVVVANRDGSNLVVVAGSTSGGGSDQPAWSPDGTKLAFRRWAPGGPPGEFNPADIWVVNADGSGATNLTADEPASVESPTWSPRQPDGRLRIAYAQQRRANGFLIGGIRSMRDDGADKRSVTSAGEYLDTEPAWSPGGSSIVFVRTGGAADGDLWVVDEATGTERALMAAGPSGAQRAPAWSPDGRLIAFTSSHEADERGAYRQVYTVWADGSKLARRTFDALDKERPAWVRRIR